MVVLWPPCSMEKQWFSVSTTVSTAFRPDEHESTSIGPITKFRNRLICGYRWGNVVNWKTICNWQNANFNKIHFDKSEVWKSIDLKKMKKYNQNVVKSVQCDGKQVEAICPNFYMIGSYDRHENQTDPWHIVDRILDSTSRTSGKASSEEFGEQGNIQMSLGAFFRK